MGIKKYTKFVSQKKRNSKSTFLTVVLWAIAAYFLLPLIWLLISATKNNAELFSTFGLWFGKNFYLFDNLKHVFTVQDGAYTRWLINTVIYSVISALGATLLSTMAGYSLAKYNYPGKKVLFSLILGSIMIPLTALAIPSYLFFSSVGLTNTYLAVIVPSLVSPFGVYLIWVYASSSLPDSIIEAARVDGAGEFRIFWQVSLPILIPGIVTVILFTLVATWNNYFLPLVMLSESKYYPLTVGLAQQQQLSTSGAAGQALFSTVITGSLVAVVPLVLVFLFLQRYWQAGLASGSIKQ